MQQEVHVESGVQRLFGVTPFRYEHRFRVGFVQMRPHLLPQEFRPIVVGVFLDEAACHVHAEAVRPQPEPEVHDVLDEQPALHRFGGVGGELPVFGDGAESVVEARLRGEAVHGRRVGTFCNASEESADRFVGRVQIRRLRHRSPDVAVGPCVAFVLAGFEEPRIVDCGMPRHEVEQHVHAQFVRVLEEPLQVRVAAVAFSGYVVVTHVVAGIVERRVEAWVDPDRIAPQITHVLQFVDDALEVTDAVAVRVVE